MSQAVDLEKPEPYGSQHVVVVRPPPSAVLRSLPATESATVPPQLRLSLDVEMPVHARYLQPSATLTHRRVFLHSPFVFLFARLAAPRQNPQSEQEDSCGKACDHNLAHNRADCDCVEMSASACASVCSSAGASTGACACACACACAGQEQERGWWRLPLRHAAAPPLPLRFDVPVGQLSGSPHARPPVVVHALHNCSILIGWDALTHDYWDGLHSRVLACALF